MKIQYCSDLHLEFPENWEFIKANPLEPKGDVLLLAGDITLFSAMEQYDEFFDYVSDNFEMVYWIPGNHEYYHYDLVNKCGSLNEKIRNNVFLVNNVTVKLEEVRFILTTLWSKISPPNQWNIQQHLSDFHVIRYKDEPFTPFHYNQLHEESHNFLLHELSEKHTGTTIVVTHHLPTLLHYPEKYKGDALNEAFATELFDLVEQSDIDFWIYGHHHQNIPSFEIGGTQLLTNQLGYVKYGEHSSFQNDALINRALSQKIRPH